MIDSIGVALGKQTLERRCTCAKKPDWITYLTQQQKDQRK